MPNRGRLVAIAAGSLLSVFFFLSNAAGSFPKPGKSDRKAVDSLCLEAVSGDRETALSTLKQLIGNADVSLGIRTYALLELGNLGLPDTEMYLYNLASKGADSQSPGDEQLRAPAYLSYQKVRFAKEQDGDRQVQMLQAALDARFAGRIQPLTRRWAVKELCNRGRIELLPKIRSTIAMLENSASEKIQIQLCERQVSVLSRHADRRVALESALEIDDEVEGEPLFHLWAICELGALGTPEAEAALLEHVAKTADEPGYGPSKERRTAIEKLRELGWTDGRLEARGIKLSLSSQWY